MADEATVRRQQLGRELHKARTAAGWTQAAIAAVLGCGQGKINKIEMTLVQVDLDELDTMLGTYHVAADKADHIRTLAAQSRRDRRPIGLPPMSPAFAHLSDLEPDATEILSLHSERIPGPLQSEHYMLQQFESHATTTEGVVELLRRRQARTRIFTSDDPPRYRVILSESSVHRMPGGRQPKLVVDQVEHLVGLIRSYHRLTLQILPFDANISFVGADFVIARFASTEPDFAYFEHPGGGKLLKARKDLVELAAHWDLLHEAALSPDDSIKFLEDIAEDARRKWRTTSND